MRSTFSQPFDEEFARRCICFLFPELGYKLKLNRKDPPDLIDEDCGVGIEVVRAVDSKDAELSNAFAMYRGKNINSVPERLAEKVSAESRGLICDDRRIIIGANFNVKSDLYGMIKKVISAKQKKLNLSGYKKFKRNGLFIYNSDRFCFETGLRMLIGELQSDTFKDIMFDFIIIYCSHEVWFCDISLDNITKRSLADEEIELLQKDSLLTLGRSREYDLKSEFQIKL